MADLLGGTTIGGYLAIHSGMLNAYLGGNKIWHEGNDGSGSGLDADLLDGKHASNFLAASSYTAADVLTKLKTVDGSGSGIDADLLDGVQASSFLRSNANDTFTGMLTTGGTTSSRTAGIYGAYNSSKIGHIWSMGTDYKIPADGTTFGNLYGMAYKHTNNTTGGTMASGHQIVFCSSGSPGAAIGLSGNVWTKGRFISTVATGTAPLTVSSTTTVTNLSADRLDGQHGSYYYRKLTSKTAGEFYTGTTAPASTNRVNFDGYLYATRVYNAWYNDYAEYFEKGEETEAGDIISLDPITKKYIKSRTYADKFIRGIHSEEYAHCIGGDGSEDAEDRFIPIGLAGRAHVKIIGKAKAGQYVVSSGISPGVGVATDEYIPGSIVGQCEEDKNDDEIGLVRLFIKHL